MLWPASGDSRVRPWQRTPTHPRCWGPMKGRPPAMQAATLVVPDPPGNNSASDRLRQLVLVRITAGDGQATRSVLTQDLAHIAPQRSPGAHWRASIERAVDALLADGLAAETKGRLRLSTTGGDAARRFLGLRGALPRTWSELVHVRLIAKALGLERLAAKELKALERPDGLRAAIVQTAYKVKVKGIATPSRLRSALAALALQRAFGNQISASLATRTTLPARAGRLLAAQLCRSPRDFGTDTRLIAALAAEHLGAKSTDIDGLRRAVLSRFFAGLADAGAEAARPPPRPAQKPEAVSPAEPAPLGVVGGRPDLPGFVLEVRRHAATHARGWVGNRKAYISHVWRALAQARSDWGLSEIEFKCMLLEAHRTGQLALANADLKDQNSMKDVQDSAVVYKNAVFHFVRADG